MINVLKLCVFTWLMLVFSLSYGATCTAKPPFLVSPSNIVVQRDTPVGTKLLEVNGPEAIVWNCSGPASSNNVGIKTYGRYVSTIGGKHIYATNIPGIGYSFGARMGGCHAIFPLGYSTVDGRDQLLMCWTAGLLSGGTINGQAYFEFYKTGNTGSGAVNSGNLGVFINELDSAWQPEVSVNIAGFNVTTLVCNITTPSLNFPIGDISAANFRGGIGSIPAGTEVTRNLGLDCDAGANINVSLQGTQNPDVSNTSVLSLSGQGSTGVAQGVGVQLLYNGAPLELNKRLLLKTSGGGKETFPVTARYYQTKTTVIPGKANTSATLDLTYQ
ncbi:fimbrial protein [Morganella morganii]|uniref:fimbrial protein n=1 Tax=Morganella morganii TaxID=582 RepID=UPI003F24584B